VDEDAEVSQLPGYLVGGVDQSRDHTELDVHEERCPDRKPTEVTAGSEDEGASLRGLRLLQILANPLQLFLQVCQVVLEVFPFSPTSPYRGCLADLLVPPWGRWTAIGTVMPSITTTHIPPPGFNDIGRHNGC
jgi:hypothetical protein